MNTRAPCATRSGRARSKVALAPKLTSTPPPTATTRNSAAWRLPASARWIAAASVMMVRTIMLPSAVRSRIASSTQGGPERVCGVGRVAEQHQDPRVDDLELALAHLVGEAHEQPDAARHHQQADEQAELRHAAGEPAAPGLRRADGAPRLPGGGLALAPAPGRGHHGTGLLPRRPAPPTSRRPTRRKGA